MFVTPKKHILARNRVFWRILRQNPTSGLGCSELQEPPPKKRGKTSRVNTFGAQSHACAKRNPWAYRDELLHRCRSVLLGLNFLQNSKFSRFWVIYVDISISTMLKFCLTERTYRNTTTTQNCARIAQGACRYCIAPWRWCILISSWSSDWLLAAM